MRRFALFALLILPGPAWADSGMLLGEVANRQMPLDAIATAPTHCYSSRRLRTGYAANKAYNIIRASDSATTDIGFLASGAPDTATETAFCNATTCKAVTVYDQCSGAKNMTQATDANRPAVALSVLGTRSGISYTSATITLSAAANFTPTTGLLSYSMLYKRAAGTGNCSFRPTGSTNNNSVGGAGTADNTRISAGSVALTRSANDTNWFSVQAIANGASSSISANGTATSGSTTLNTTAGLPSDIGSASTTCYFMERAVWDNYSLTSAEQSFLNRGLRADYGF